MCRWMGTLAQWSRVARQLAATGASRGSSQSSSKASSLVAQHSAGTPNRGSRCSFEHLVSRSTRHLTLSLYPTRPLPLISPPVASNQPARAKTQNELFIETSRNCFISRLDIPQRSSREGCSRARWALVHVPVDSRSVELHQTTRSLPSITSENTRDSSSTHVPSRHGRDFRPVRVKHPLGPVSRTISVR